MHNKDEQQFYSGTERQGVGNRDQGVGATTGGGGGEGWGVEQWGRGGATGVRGWGWWWERGIRQMNQKAFRNHQVWIMKE